MEKAYGYIRVSGKGQINGDGFARQTKAINDYAKSNGFEIVRIYKEKGVSGTIKNSPALTDMMISLIQYPERSWYPYSHY
jgi:DNA invertase Pin-like site-specific DNA recombinase